MDEIIAVSKRKLILLMIVAVTVISGSGLFSFLSVKSGFLIKSLIEITGRATGLERNINDFFPRVEEAKRMGSILTNIKYTNTLTLRETLFRELESIGLVVSDISLKEKTGKEEKNKGLIEVNVAGAISLEKIPDFLKSVSSRPKIWGVENIDINPKISPAELVSQFMLLHRKGDRRGISLFIEQGKDFLSKENSSVVDLKMRFVVVGG